MSKSTFLIVDSSVLPDVFEKVIAAKKLIRFGKASSAAEAARLAGISRSAFYKYKDTVFPYEEAADRIITVHAVLKDVPGVLSAFISTFFDAGANILTVNQNIPVGGAASVSVSARTDNMEISVEELLVRLQSINGVETIENISGM